MQFVLYKFRPGETIDAVLRLLGRHNYTSTEMGALRAEFIRINDNVVPRAGTTFKIPLLDADPLKTA